MRPPLACRRALVIAPHPDDEVIAAWALMRHLRAAGAVVEVIVVSDGSASHPGSRTWPVPRLVAERRRETRRALRTLAVPPTRIRFLGLPDGGLERAPDLSRRLARAVLGRRAAQLIVAPLPGDAHADHRAVADALAALPRRGERRLGYQVWPEGAGRGRAVVRQDAAAMRIKRRVVRSYRTQGGLINDAQAGFAMTHRHLHAFVRPVERFALT
jgi:LmbE family N-acetylglucosaminyl deacetylase